MNTFFVFVHCCASRKRTQTQCAALGKLMPRAQLAAGPPASFISSWWCHCYRHYYLWRAKTSQFMELYYAKYLFLTFSLLYLSLWEFCREATLIFSTVFRLLNTSVWCKVCVGEEFDHEFLPAEIVCILSPSGRSWLLLASFLPAVSEENRFAALKWDQTASSSEVGDAHSGGSDAVMHLFWLRLHEAGFMPR